MFLFSRIFSDDDIDQATLTDRLKRETWNCNKDVQNRIFAHNHYRVAFTEVGYPLSYLLGTKELMHATLTAFYGKRSHVHDENGN